LRQGGKARFIKGLRLCAQKEQNNIFITDAEGYMRFVDNNGKFINVDSKEGVYILTNWHLLKDIK
jgi:hypothetical protein